MSIAAVAEVALQCQSVSESNREFNSASKHYFITLLLLNCKGAQRLAEADGRIGKIIVNSPDQRDYPFVYKGVTVHRTSFKNGFVQASLEVQKPDALPPIPQTLDA